MDKLKVRGWHSHVVACYKCGAENLGNRGIGHLLTKLQRRRCRSNHRGAVLTREATEGTYLWCPDVYK